ncbi:MAG: hypothetical protein HYV63_14020 [Candidatus Schekmanbacteria bacterium]|nr:hypothetical protein [Candidatus Schekmanbacteria bacterium]
MSNTRTTHALTSPPTPRRAAVLGLARGRLHRLSLFAVLVTVGWVIGLRGVRAAVDQPVYIYLYAHTEDHINHDLSEERYRRLLPVLEALATSHPEYHVSVSMQFPGADTEALLTRNAENGILDFILSYQANGLIEAGYHGAHEPTYVNNALVTLPANATWEEHVGAGLEYLSYAKHPTRGDVDESRSGGLLLNLQTFGEARAVSGTAGAGVAKFFDTAVEHSVTNLLAGAGTATVSSTGGPVMLGLPDHGPGGGADYEATAAELIALLSPRADTPAEVFWMNNALRVNDGDFVDGVHAIIAHEGVATLKAKLAGLDRSRVHVLNVAVAGKWIYAKESPTKYAYAHPTSPELHAALQNTREQIETAASCRTQTWRRWREPRRPGKRWRWTRSSRRRASSWRRGRDDRRPSSKRHSGSCRWQTPSHSSRSRLPTTATGALCLPKRCSIG